MHVHIACPDGEAKFWLEPIIALADHTGLPARELKRMQAIIEERRDEIVQSWQDHFAT